MPATSRANAFPPVMHVLQPAEIGGIESVVRILASTQARMGRPVRVAAVIAADALDSHPFPAQLRHEGVPIDIVPTRARGYLAERRAVAALCRMHSPAVVHTHGYRVDILVGGAARALGMATVTTMHGFSVGDWKNRLYERLQVAAFKRFEAVVAVSKPLLEDLARRGVPRAKLHMVRNAWRPTTALMAREQARAELGLSPKDFVIGWVGRFAWAKAPSFMLEAMAHLRDLPITLSMLGDGDEREALIGRAQALGITDRVKWHGVVPDAGRAYSAFDVFAISSRTEGTPIALFEAMHAGVPIVSTRVGGIPDVVGDADAVLVPPGDPAALAAAIRSVYAGRMAARERAESAQARLVAEHSLERWVGEYDGVYAAALAAR